MKQFLKKAIFKSVYALGYKIERLVPPTIQTHYLKSDGRYADIIKVAEPFTMTPYKKIAAMIDAARYIVREKIPGAIVECGVWRGGSMMAAALALKQMNEFRDLYLFDTYAGMTSPTDKDIDYKGLPAQSRYLDSRKQDHNEWCYASVEEVRKNLESTGYPMDKCHFIKGDILQTVPHDGLKEIAILRLDTDWYESTLHELKHLYPQLNDRGILIIDDYGYWRGCKKAVDEFFAKGGPFLCRIDSTGLLGVKTK